MPREPVIVIGAGAGGLSAAALLAHAGEDVLVLECGTAPGGKMRHVDVGGFAIEAGPTVLTMRHVFDALFDACGGSLDDYATLRPASVLARHAWPDGTTLDLFADREASAGAIGAAFGAREERGFRAFCRQAEQIRTTLDRPFLQSPRPTPLSLAWRVGRPDALLGIHPFQPMMAALARHFADPRLRQLFGRYATYAGSSPWRAPATLMLIAAVEQAGVWLVEGGMSTLAAALAGLAEHEGARLRYSAKVAGINVERGRVAGVTLASGETIAARSIVFNGDPAALAAGLLGSSVRKAARGEKRSLSALVWTIAGSAHGAALAHHNVFFSSDYAAEFADLEAGRVPGGPTVYLCAQDRDAVGKLGGTGVERFQLIVNAPPIGDEGELAETELERCETAMMACLARCGVTINRQATHLTTPAAFAARFPGTGGALYGPAAHGWRAAFRRPGARTSVPGLYLAGGSTHPGAGVPMAALSGRLAAEQLLRDLASTRRSSPGGYRWWYVDALSEDRRHGLTIIAFIGSVFSPYYHWAKRRDAEDHVALNVALYGERRGWAMTERRRHHLARSADRLVIGPSALNWDGDGLTIDIDEVTAPLPSRLRGTVRVEPLCSPGHLWSLDASERHRWQPLAPRARVEVDLRSPALRWRGEGYFDTNDGDEPLEDGFSDWRWSRAHLQRDTVVLYEGRRRDRSRFALGLRFDQEGGVATVPLPPETTLPQTGWRMPRITRADPARQIVIRKTWEDTPFYARTALSTHLFGEAADGVHESLSLDRLRHPLVRLMLPFRMPRVLW